MSPQITLQDIEVILHKSRNHLQNAFAYVSELPPSRVKSLFDAHLAEQWERQRYYEQALLQEMRQTRQNGSQFGLVWWIPAVIIGGVASLGAGGWFLHEATNLWKHLTGAAQTEDLAKCVEKKQKEGWLEEAALQYCQKLYGKQGAPTVNIMGVLTSLLVMGGVGIGAYYLIKSLKEVK